MDTFKLFTQQVSNIWSRWTVLQRAGIGAVVGVCVLGFAGILFWASAQEYVTLVDHLTPVRAHEVVSALEAEGIDYKLNFAGSAVSVPTRDVNVARIALKEVGLDVQQDEETELGFFTDPMQQKSRQHRALEKRIASSIQQMTAVKGATVHLTLPDPSPFIRDQSPPKASVILQLANQGQFTSVDARAVASLVSHSVENLDPENTTIIDTDGRVLSSSDSMAGDVGGQLEYRRRFESDLASKAEAMLLPLLGPGRAVVRVSADIDFTEKSTSKHTYDPDTKVKKSETIETTTTRGRINGSAGKPGTASNVGSDRGSDINGDSSQTEKIETEFENTEIVDTIRELPGTLQRLTVAAVVELPENSDSTDASAAAVTAVVTKDQIEGIIKQAIGFDADRNDQIEVVAGKLLGYEPPVIPTGWAATWQSLEPYLGTIALVLATLVTLVVGLLIVKKLKPIVVEVDRRNNIDPEMRARLADLTDEIRSNPEVVSTVFSAWLSGEAQTSETKDVRKAA